MASKPHAAPHCGSRYNTCRADQQVLSTRARCVVLAMLLLLMTAHFQGSTAHAQEAEPVWTAFLCKLTRRGLRGVKLVISDAHESIKAATAKVLCATWQRCRVHFMTNVLAHAGKSGRRVASAFISTPSRWIRPKPPAPSGGAWPIKSVPRCRSSPP